MRQHTVSKADKAFYFALFYTLLLGMFIIIYFGAEYKAEQYGIKYKDWDYNYGPLAYGFVETYCYGNYSSAILNLTLREKIAQMLIAKMDLKNADAIGQIGIGGVYLGGMTSKEAYKNLIKRSKESSKIPLFISLDLEGYWNPFSNFHDFPTAAEMGKMDDAEVYRTAADMAKLCKELGFNLNFAPVVDLSYGDDVWVGRAFSRESDVVARKASVFIKGFQDQQIFAVAKHFPGETIGIADTHFEGAHADISENDLMPFYAAAQSGVRGMMMNHLTTAGEVESNGVPASVSKAAVSSLRGFFDGLVMTDDLSMKAIASAYSPTRFLCLTEKWGCSAENASKQRFIDAINAGNDVLLITSITDVKEVGGIIGVIENAVASGEIEEETIDTAVVRIFRNKCDLFS
jgi:beta-N-acetylhexosaminidase